MIKGVKKLPVIINDKEYIKVLEKCNLVSRKLERLNVELNSSPISKNLISLLSYNESVQSTKIEGTQVTFTEIIEVKEDKKVSFEQREILNYKKAIDYGFLKIKKEKMPISTRLIQELHEILMKNARGTSSNAGNFRKIQNFIGRDSNIKNADYIPIGANEVPEYMTNLEYFINGENHSSFEKIMKENETAISYDSLYLLKIAIAHAQFESIHPFLDGNGRLGRILIVLMSINYDIFSQPLFFVSEELEKEKIRYYNSLNKTRGDEPDWLSWINLFLNACETMGEKLLNKISRINNYYYEKSKTLKNQTEKEVLMWTIYDPICTVTSITKKTKLHYSTVRKTLNSFANREIIAKDTSKKRNVKYYNYDVIKIMNS